jgi:drug/metabolite transporter (DMT)-like permease
MIYALEPAFAAGFAILWGETIPARGWMGGGLIVLGALVSEWGARRAPSHAP